jgi:phosphoglycolate phosphatase-like HAD superfamily hydrolase
VGTKSVTGYVRIYPQIEDLIGALQDNGFDVWVVTASPQFVVEPFAGRLEIPADHVVGIRQTQADGKLTYDFQGCGPIPDGTNDGAGNVTGDSLITYIEGKRCWMNKIIYGDTGATALQRNEDESKRPVFGAGDSDTDISFLQDATALRLAVNRNKKEIMCNAYAGFGVGTWIINPMFIAPKPKLDSGYACSTTACKDAAGASVPCRDENGAVLPDQQDSVFCQSGEYCQ